jgi:hypothetical protein
MNQIKQNVKKCCIIDKVMLQFSCKVGRGMKDKFKKADETVKKEEKVEVEKEERDTFDFKKESKNKKKIPTVNMTPKIKKGILVAVILIVGIFLIVMLTRGNQEKELTKELKSLGTEFYEDFYYVQSGSTTKEKKEILEKYTDLGIKVSLDSLSRYKIDEKDEILAKFVNEKTNESCDTTNSMVTIYPQSPYGKSDYKIETKLVCGFSDESK